MPTHKHKMVQMAKTLYHQYHVPYVLAFKIAKAINSQMYSWGNSPAERLFNETVSTMGLTLNNYKKEYLDWGYDDRLETHGTRTWNDKYGITWYVYASNLAVIVPDDLSVLE